MQTDTLSRTFVLLVSRDPSALFPHWKAGSESWRLEIADSGWQALERVQSTDSPNLILLDLGENAADGLHTLRWLRRVRPETPVVLLSRSADALQKTEALRLGAKDYLVKPLQEAILKAVIERYLDPRENDEELPVSSDNIEIVAGGSVFVSASAAMRALRAQAGLLAQIDAPLLLVGESDSGKEITARLIHKLSVRSEFPFVKVNCSALPPDFLEAELFGDDKTIGTVSSSGKLERGQRGTIYFDEITALPLRLQEKLVYLLQEKASSQGSESRLDPSFRLIAATCANIEEALAEGKLREDLYFRMSAFTAYVPQLKERREDISLLLTHFMNQLSRHYGLPARIFSPTMLRACQNYSWPGNLKELENFAKRFLVVGDEELALTELEQKVQAAGEPTVMTATLEFPTGHRTLSVDASAEPKNSSTPGLKSLVQTVIGEAERAAIATALEQTNWNRKAASKILQVSYRTLLYKIQHYHLSPPSDYSAVFAGQAVKSGGPRQR